MKIISHPQLIRQKEEELLEKERELDVQRYNIEISLMLIREREESISRRNKVACLFFSIVFLCGLSLGILAF